MRSLSCPPWGHHSRELPPDPPLHRFGKPLVTSSACLAVPELVLLPHCSCVPCHLPRYWPSLGRPRPCRQGYVVGG